ncbi:MAG: hypothetical protein JWQ42_2957 [Edaphobacter sp.]|nr:hypothetical protein [Edaphobacter sp.]
MAHSGAGRTLAAKGGGSGSLHGNVGYLDRERALSAGPKVRKKEEDEQKGTLPKAIIVEQWICFVLGFACMAFGIWGICMKPGQYAHSAYIAWLGSLYVPALRVTAVACLGMGVVLIRRGWTHL